MTSFRPLTIVEDEEEFHQLKLKRQQPSSKDTTNDNNNYNNKDEKLSQSSRPQQQNINNHQRRARQLSNDDDSYSYYLVDSYGDEYDPYSLGWRYIGMYRDCSNVYYYNDGGNDDDGSTCENVLLWAAYHDPFYIGDQIGEYAIYDTYLKRWDRTGCNSHLGGRCAKLNCHEDGNWFNKHQLVGIFKETYGMYEWSEQLFKHQGYCIFPQDDDYGYDFMQNERENNLPFACEWYRNAVDTNWTYHSFYWQVAPAPEGLIRIGLYEDSACAVESIFNVQDVLYATNGGEVDAVRSYERSLQEFNRGLQVFQVCQPCRAYNFNPSSSAYYNNDDDGNNDDGGNNRRSLNNDDYYYYNNNDDDNGNDGEGGDEYHGFNCYDDAGYTNCNQCYKFFTQTSLEVASTSDLQEATAQGTILSIRDQYGRSYGSGHYPPNFAWARDQYARNAWIRRTVGTMLLVFFLLVAIVLFLHFRRILRRRRKRRKLASFRDHWIALGGLLSAAITKYCCCNNNKATEADDPNTTTTAETRQGRRPKRLRGRMMPASFQENLMEESSSPKPPRDDDSKFCFVLEPLEQNDTVVPKSHSWSDSVFATSEFVTEVVMDPYAKFLHQQGLVVEETASK